MIAALRRKRAERRDEQSGVTLVELLVSVVILTMITGALSSAFVTAFRGARPTQERIRESNTAQNIAAFLVRDAQSAGGSVVETGLADPTLGVFLTGDGGCLGGTGELVVRFNWIERGPDATTHVAKYTYDSTTRELSRTECVGASSASPLPLGRNISNSPVPVAACETAASASTACNPELPDFVTLSITMANTAGSSTTPYSYVLRASTRPDAPSEDDINNEAPTVVPVLILGGGCASGGGIDLPGIDVGTGNPTVTVYGQANINNSCPAVDIGGSGSYSASGGTVVSPPATCTGVPGLCTVASTALADPYKNLTPPDEDCVDGTHPPNSGATYYPGTYKTLLSVSAANFEPGVYVFCEGVSVSGTTDALGALFYIVDGTLTVVDDFTITPPTSGPYSYANRGPGIAIWQKSTNPTTMQMCCSNNNSLTVEGVVYVPGAIVRIKNGTTNIKSIVALGLEFATGNGDTYFNQPNPLLSMTTTTLPASTINRPYPNTTMVAAGGGGGNVWTATGLPTGMAIGTFSGTISGTPTASGNFTVAVSVTDRLGTRVTRSIALVINATPSINAITLANWTVNRDYPDRPVSVTAGTPLYTFSADNLPTGMSIDSATGVIGGRPTAIGTFTPTLHVVDKAGATASRVLIAFTINQTPTIGSPTDLVDWTFNRTYPDTQINASLGTPPYTWNYSLLPTGMSVSGSGVVQGVPTASGPFNSAITVVDSAGASFTRTYAFTINSRAGIVSTLPGGDVGVFYSRGVSSGGGTGPFTYVITGGTLPAASGLSINANTGVISGTPTTATTYSIDIRVTDSTGDVITQNNVGLTISNLPQISATTLPARTIDTTYTNTPLTGTGGTPNYSWTATGFPAGMGINGSGVISGTPRASGNFTIRVTLTDAAGGTVSRDFALTINPAPEVATTSLPAGVQGRAYTSTTLTASSGTPPYGSWTANGLTGTGLSLSSGGVLSGTPTIFGTINNVQITVVDSSGASATKTFSIVIAPRPTVLSASPSSVPRGATNKDITITGTDFVSGTGLSTAVSGTGVTVNSTTFVSSTQLTVNVSVAAGATLSARNVTVTNPDGGTNSGTGILTVSQQPTFSSVSPNFRPQGASGAVLLVNGSNFASGGANVSFSGAGITVDSVSFVSTSQLQVVVSISGSAAIGARDLTVTNFDGGQVTANNAFSVTAAPATLPTVSAVNLNAIGQGATRTVTITGTNFVNGAGGSVAVSGPGVSVSTSTWNSPTQITATIVVAGGAAIGTRDIIVTNPDGGAGTGTGLLTINASPTITSISPPTRPKNSTGVSVVITGTGFVSGATVTFSGANGPPTATNVVVDSSTQITATINTTNQTRTYDVTVTNSDLGAAMLAGSFTTT